MEHIVTVLMTEFVTHDVKRFIVTRPEEFVWEPGQGVEIALDEPGWREEGRPFTPTSLADDEVLEFTIKEYPEHDGVTTRLHDLGPGARLRMSEAFGTITYAGPGVFIAGGAGLTPFVAILRELAESGRLAGHRLLFSNKTPADVILEKELRHYLGEECILTCTRESGPGYLDERIDGEFLSGLVDDFSQSFYVCGPPDFTSDLNEAISELGGGAENLVFEE